MDGLKLGARIAGIVFLGFAFFAFFLSLALLLAPYEIGELEKRANTELPPKIVNTLDLAVPELRQITLDQLKVGCLLRSGLGLSNVSSIVKDIPFSEQDLNFICEKANQVISMQELKEAFVSKKFGEILGQALMKVRKEIIEPYSYAYFPITIVSQLAFTLISILAFYFSEREIAKLGRKFAFHSWVFSVIYFLILAVIWLVSPSLVEKQVIENPQVTSMIAQLSDAQKPAVDIFMSEVIKLLSLWVEGVLIHFMIIYILIGIASAIIWAAFGGISKIREKLDEGQI